jgi:hypothetical protein
VIEKRTVEEYSGQTNVERHEKEIGHGQKLLVKVKHETMNIYEVEFQAIEMLLNTKIQSHILSYPRNLHKIKIYWGGGACVRVCVCIYEGCLKSFTPHFFSQNIFIQNG